MNSRPEKSLLRALPPSRSSKQHPTQNDASGYATTTQHAPAKPLSLLELARNRLCNNHAITTENGMQQAREELTRLVRLCGTHYAFTESEHADALAIALADPVNALTCFRGMALTSREEITN